MTRNELETLAVMAAVAAACAVPGVFLVLRRLVLVGDAISHVLLLGIVLAFFLVRDPASPWLMLGAAATGVLTVALVELLQATKRVKEDAAIGLVFPALFALGAILVTMFTRDIHLDIDQVLLGSAELSTIDRFAHFGINVPLALVVVGGCFLANAGLVALVYKELKLTTFDAGLAAVLGFAPVALHYGLMTAVSLTAVAAFDAVGPVLVVAFFAVPAVAARLLTERLSRVLVLSVVIAVMAAVAGTALAIRLDTNIAGTVTTVLGFLFTVVFLLAPHRGLLAEAVRRFRQKRTFHEVMLAIHLQRHEGTPEEADEAAINGIHGHLNWSRPDAGAVVQRALRQGWVTREAGLLKLTAAGRALAEGALRLQA